jgi:hypothetical protein
VAFAEGGPLGVPSLPLVAAEGETDCRVVPAHGQVEVGHAVDGVGGLVYSVTIPDTTSEPTV